MESRRPILTNAQPTEVVQPGQGSLHVPAVFPQPATVTRSTPCDVRSDATPSQPLAMRIGVIATVPIEAIRTTSRPARLAANWRDCVDQRDHRIHIGNVGGGRLGDQWDPTRIGDHLVLTPLFAAIHRAGAGLSTSAPCPREATIDQGTPPIDLVRAVQLGQQQLVELRPDTGLGPVAEPTPAGHATATAHLLGQILPIGDRPKLTRIGCVPVDNSQHQAMTS